MNQDNKTAYPVGQTYVFDIGVAQIAHHYLSTEEMRYQILTGSRAGDSDTIAIQVKAIRPGLFWVSWQEADKITVTHLEDFENGTFEASITLPDLSFIRCSGKMWRQD